MTNRYGVIVINQPSPQFGYSASEMGDFIAEIDKVIKKFQSTTMRTIYCEPEKNELEGVLGCAERAFYELKHGSHDQLEEYVHVGV